MQKSRAYLYDYPKTWMDIHNLLASLIPDVHHRKEVDLAYCRVLQLHYTYSVAHSEIRLPNGATS